MKENQITVLIFSFFFLFGLTFFIIGLFIPINNIDYSKTKETTGIITDIYKEKTYVSYEVDNVSYESFINGYISTYRVGDEIDIYYFENDPSMIGTKELDFFIPVFTILGIIFMIVGIIPITVVIHKKRVRKRLKENGQLIYANYVETIYNTRYIVNGKSPYNIVCQYKDPMDGKEYIYKSENIWFNPDIKLGEKCVKQIPVYVDINNKNKYVVDIDIILND